MSNTILIQCPACEKSKTIPRDRLDPVRATVMVTLCPECCDIACAHHPSVDYYDAQGTWLNSDSEVW